MTTREDPLDPREVLAAAEAAHLAARWTVPISRDPTPADATHEDPGEEDPGDDIGEEDDHDDTRPTVRLDHVTVRLDRQRRLVPRQRPPSEGRRHAPLPLAAGVAALWAALATFIPVAVVVTLLLLAEGGPAALAAPARVAAAGWLLAHGVPSQTAAGPVGLAPLALAAFAAWRVARAGVHVTRTRAAASVPQALLSAGAVAVAYGVVGALAAVAAGGSGWGPQVPRAALTLAVFAFAAAGYGSLRVTGALAALARRTPVALRYGGRAGLVAAAGVLAAGAATVGTALAVSGGAAAELVAAYGTGVAGQVGLTLLCLAYAPNLASWAAAYLVGPGFAVGTDTVVRSSEVALGPLPAVPVLAALPAGPLPTLGAALLAAPVIAGGVAGWLLVRWERADPGEPDPEAQPLWVRLVLAALVAGAVGGALLGGVAAASGGPLGGGQLALVGPDPVLVGVATAATVAPGALLGAGVAAVLGRRRPPVDR